MTLDTESIMGAGVVVVLVLALFWPEIRPWLRRGRCL